MVTGPSPELNTPTLHWTIRAQLQLWQNGKPNYEIKNSSRGRCVRFSDCPTQSLKTISPDQFSRFAAVEPNDHEEKTLFPHPRAYHARYRPRVPAPLARLGPASAY